MNAQAPLAWIEPILTLALFDSLPSLFLYLQVRHPIKYSIAAHHYKVLMLISRGGKCRLYSIISIHIYGELSNFRLCYHYTRFPSKFL